MSNLQSMCFPLFVIAAGLRVALKKKQNRKNVFAMEMVGHHVQ